MKSPSPTPSRRERTLEILSFGEDLKETCAFSSVATTVIASESSSAATPIARESSTEAISKPILTALLALFTLTTLISTPSLAQTAIKADTIYTMAGQKIINGVILIKAGKIERVGSSSEVNIPADYQVHEAKAVTPGLIDAHTVVGLSGVYNYRHDQDQLEKSDAIQPELRAIDAYNMNEKLVDYLLTLGITTIHTGHGPGALASGQTMTVKTFGTNLNEVILDSSAMVAFTLGSDVSDNYKKPGTRAKGVAMLRQEFIKAEEYTKKLLDKNIGDDKKPARDLKMEILSDVIAGKYPALFTTNRANDIMSALRLQQEFGFKLILDGAAESYLLIDEIKKANIPVIIHPSMARNFGDMKNISTETAAQLTAAGIKIAMQSGYEDYVPKTRIVLFEAAIANANGLSFEDALAAITINPAQILGVDKRVGSIEPGKDADLVLFDGNPFEYTTHVCKVFVNGILVKNECY